MNIEPCVRLGIRISPKIRENPADNKNKRPPNVTLLTVSSSQHVISADLQLSRLLMLLDLSCSANAEHRVTPADSASTPYNTELSPITGSSGFADDDRRSAQHLLSGG